MWPSLMFGSSQTPFWSFLSYLYIVCVCVAIMTCNKCYMSDEGVYWLMETEGFKPDFYNDEGNLAIWYAINLK
ncbi:hypothetical protein BJX99DRAFT_226295 [Aspergillus californicus]